MHPLEKKTLQAIEKEKLLLPEETVLVGVSAGADSMALLQVLGALRPFLRCSLVAVYVDHGLRPGETEGEAALVQEAARRLAIPYRFRRVDVRGQARARRLSVEHAGRLLRYACFDEIAAAEQATKIAVAHTADDQAEELLIRLLRGTGRGGLSGMRRLREGRIVRPFLGIAKEQLVAYLRDKQLIWHEDSSNQQTLFLRNKIRLNLLPQLEEEYNPGIRQTLRQTATILQAEEDLLADLTHQARERIMAKTTAGGLPVVEIRAAALIGFPLAIQRRVVEEALREMGHSPSFRQIEQVLRLFTTAERGSQVHLAGGLRVYRKDGLVLFAYPHGRGSWRGGLEREQTPAFELTITEPGAEHAIPALGKAVRVEHLQEVPSAEELRRAEADYLDFAHLSFPLCLRSPHPGDRFRPLGVSGHQKMSDFLINNKVPAGKRWQVPLLLSEGEVVAVLGMRIGHQVRITSATREVLRVAFIR